MITVDELVMDKKVTQAGLLISHYGATVDVEDNAGQVHRCVLRQNLEPLVVGDQVTWETGSDGCGVITGFLNRRSSLVRPSRHGGLKPVAANIDLMVIVIAVHPAFTELLLDQYLVAAELLDIQPLILLNKQDLLKTPERQSMEKRLQVYKDIGVPVIFASSHDKKSFKPLLDALKNKTSVFVGQSGVGKSSLVQALLPASKLKISEVSQQGHGRHTTTVARLYHLQEGGNVIDSPGVREFGLWNITAEELFKGFKEFLLYQGKCQFRNCQHDHELGCAIKSAVKSGDLSKQRFNNFKKLLASIKHV